MEAGTGARAPALSARPARSAPGVATPPPPPLTPTLAFPGRAVTRSKKSWQARHTGIKIVQQIAILLGCAILPHLNQLVEVVKDGLDDENQKVRTMAALAVSAMAEAAAPYGIESFDPVLRPLWEGIRKHRGKVLAAFLKAIGFIVPLMDAVAQNYYTREASAPAAPSPG